MRKQDVQQRTGQLGWDELRTVLAVSRQGSLSGAARELGVQHSTVLRRINDLEGRLGVKLFDRARWGYLANAHGEAVAEAAAAMEEAALAAERQVLSADDRLVGTIRIATSELLSVYLLMPLLDAFTQRYPCLTLEIDVSNRSVDLDRRDADLALRATRSPPDHLVGRELAKACSAVYGVQRFLPFASDLAAAPWLGYHAELARSPQATWMNEHLPDVRVVARLNAHTALIRAAALGVGVALLPCFTAMAEPPLVHLANVDMAPVGIWLLSHPDVRGNARVRAVAAFLAEHVPQRLAAADATAQAAAAS